MSEQQIVRAIIRTIYGIMQDLVWELFDHSGKRIPPSTAIRKIVEHANENKKFWEIIEYHYFYTAQFKEMCSEGLTAEDALENAARALGWKKLTER